MYGNSFAIKLPLRKHIVLDIHCGGLAYCCFWAVLRMNVRRLVVDLTVRSEKLASKKLSVGSWLGFYYVAAVDVIRRRWDPCNHLLWRSPGRRGRIDIDTGSRELQNGVTR